MDAIGTLVNIVAVAVVGLVVVYYGRERFEMLGSQLSDLQRRMERMEDGLRSELAGVRSDLTLVALAVGAKPRRNAR